MLRQPVIACLFICSTLLSGWLCHAQTPVPTSAQVAVPPLTGHVTDTTHTLTDEQQNKIEKALTAFELRKGSQLAVLLVATTQPETIEQYAMRVAEQWKLGRKKIDDGAILIVAKNDRTVRIEVGYGLEGVLNDATSKRIIEEIITPNFRQQNFAGGIAAGVRRMMRVIEGEPLPAPTPDNATDAFMDVGWIVVAGAFLGFVLGVLSMALIAAGITLLTTLLGITGLLNARYGGRGGPGGGFKGGGGGFGGGGASGRW